MAGEANTETQRRQRVVKGWAFKDLTPEEVASIKAYLNGGAVPENYAQLDRIVK